MAHHNWREIEERMAPDRLAAIKSRARSDMEQILLSELRKRSGRTPESVAVDMGIDDHSYSELEASDDMPIGTLQKLVRALGGELDILVHLPGREFALSQFAESR